MSSIFYAHRGYGAGGPMSVPADTRSVRSRGRVESGYGDFSAHEVIGGEGFGDDPGVPSVASINVVSGGLNASTAIGVGLTVWLITKVLDRMFFKGGN